MRGKRKAVLAAVGICGVYSIAARACEEHEALAFMLNLNGATGTSGNTTINNIVKNISADVQSLQYTADNTYIRSTDVPSHTVGPFTGNPNTPSNQNLLVRVPHAPAVNNGTKTATSLGAIGMMVNGVVFYNASDGHTYNNAGVWTQNANVVEAASFDIGMGHPQQQGQYHYHQQPALLRQQLADDGTHHSPVLGFAYDGFPVYGPYGYANNDGSGGVKRMLPSYQLRNITARTTKPDGTALSANQYGPAVSAAFPLGYYLEDYGYAAGSGDLDTYNGRFAITPEYPQGTYAYFTTIDAAGKAAYPYIVGPQYYGVLINENRTQTVSVAAGAATLSMSLNASWSGLSGGSFCQGTNWAGGVAPGGIGSTATFAANSAAPMSIALDDPRRIGTINFNATTSYTISGSMPLTFLATTGAGINVTAGSHKISAPIVMGTNGTFNVGAGASLELTALQPTAASINKTGAGALKLGTLSCAALSVGGGSVQLSSSMTIAARVTSLNLTNGASLDLANNRLVIDYTGSSPAATTRSQIINGSITSAQSAIDAAGSHPTAIGYAEASTLGATTFGGQSADTTSLLLRYTYTGDSNLDGTVTASDFTQLAQNFGATNRVWSDGDFNYDGAVNALDFNAIATNFGAATLAAPFALGALVPEPCVVLPITLLGLILRGRRN